MEKEGSLFCSLTNWGDREVRAFLGLGYEVERGSGSRIERMNGRPDSRGLMTATFAAVMSLDFRDLNVKIQDRGRGEEPSG